MMKQVWLHVKTQQEYEIKDFGIDENSMEPVVIYYPTRKPDSIWVRNAREFFDGRFRMTERSVRSGAAKPNFGKGAEQEVVATATAEIDIAGTVDRKQANRVARRDRLTGSPGATLNSCRLSDGN